MEKAVAIVEVVLSQVHDPNRIYSLADECLPHYRLLKKARIHDFHRNPSNLTAAPEEGSTLYIQGPIRLSTGPTEGSVAILRIGPDGELAASGDGAVDRRGAGRRAEELVIKDGLLKDEDGSFVGLDSTIDRFLMQAPTFLARVAALS